MPDIRRRTVLTWLGAAAGCASVGGIATAVVAETTIGSGTLRTVSDGHLVLPESFVIGDLPADEARAILEAAGIEPGAARAPCNLTLWTSGDRRVLFDAGSGAGFMPTAGEITAGLDALGLAPDDITDLVFTHGHPDHLWGALDDFDEPLFANARHVMAETEAAYWSDPATVDALGEARQSFAVGAARRIETLGDRLERVAEDAEVMPGLRLVPLPGHTPGHVGARITDGDASRWSSATPSATVTSRWRGPIGRAPRTTTRSAGSRHAPPCSRNWPIAARPSWASTCRTAASERFRATARPTAFPRSERTRGPRPARSATTLPARAQLPPASATMVDSRSSTCCMAPSG
ncbi:MBL fold metallo-hydrolase [Roseivivax marinus]|uniref:MBL fold metallo-hydrolase n=1 Tax=Roseivivax marinus TaxID=1379903 RepID=UPI001F0411B3|nr:MBL fold metallo-hydrolase [Roseivivax marinus]UMA66460.1 MBL fold metallo-hydrolase [Roseivivax marinus]